MKPDYTKAEQRERMREFERWVLRAREDWRAGIAVVLMSYRDYLELSRTPPQQPPKDYGEQ